MTESSSWHRTLRRAALLVACVTGCAAPSARSAAESPAAASKSSAPGTLPGCAGASTRIERPADFPARFPLPPGAVIASEERRSGGRIILHTFVPSGIRDVAVFFDKALPEAGYRQSGGESESDEAEANFEDSSLKGRWRARSIDQCPGAVSLDVLVGTAGG
ncbi:MAG: hypothetical protein ACJ8AT_26535 [Hyalangium sp.]|uniref:hypothetical protein n=1 Tax=Hyalangium sp. TaxID=2028555 RepID=UPI00389B0074